MFFRCDHKRGKISLTFTRKNRLLCQPRGAIHRESLYKKQQRKQETGTKSTYKIPMKACTEKLWNLCMKNGGAHTTHNTQDCLKVQQERKLKMQLTSDQQRCKKPQSHKAVFCTIMQQNGQAWKGDQEPNVKRRNIAVAILIPTQNRGLGWVS